MYIKNGDENIKPERLQDIIGTIGAEEEYFVEKLGYLSDRFNNYSLTLKKVLFNRINNTVDKFIAEVPKHKAEKKNLLPKADINSTTLSTTKMIPKKKQFEMNGNAILTPILKKEIMKHKSSLLTPTIVAIMEEIRLEQSENSSEDMVMTDEIVTEKPSKENNILNKSKKLLNWEKRWKDYDLKKSKKVVHIPK